jgi:hypothetical protein
MLRFIAMTDVPRLPENGSKDDTKSGGRPSETQIGEPNIKAPLSPHLLRRLTVSFWKKGISGRRLRRSHTRKTTGGNIGS